MSFINHNPKEVRYLIEEMHSLPRPLRDIAVVCFPDRVARKKSGMLADLAGGLSYLRQRPTLRTLVLLALIGATLRRRSRKAT